MDLEIRRLGELKRAKFFRYPMGEDGNIFLGGEIGGLPFCFQVLDNEIGLLPTILDPEETVEIIPEERWEEFGITQRMVGSFYENRVEKELLSPKTS